MAAGLMEGYTNTTPSGFEGVGGNAEKASVSAPNTAGMTNNNQMTDTGETMTSDNIIDKTIGMLSEESKLNFSAIASPSTLQTVKEFLVKSERFTPEEVASLDKLQTEEMVHIPLRAILENPQAISSQLEQLAMSNQGAGNTMSQTPGMMANNEATPTNRPLTQPV